MRVKLQRLAARQGQVSSSSASPWPEHSREETSPGAGGRWGPSVHRVGRCVYMVLMSSQCSLQNLQVRCCWSYFTDEETEAREAWEQVLGWPRSDVTDARSLSHTALLPLQSEAPLLGAGPSRGDSPQMPSVPDLESLHTQLPPSTSVPTIFRGTGTT